MCSAFYGGLFPPPYFFCYSHFACRTGSKIPWATNLSSSSSSCGRKAKGTGRALKKRGVIVESMSIEIGSIQQIPMSWNTSGYSASISSMDWSCTLWTPSTDILRASNQSRPSSLGPWPLMTNNGSVFHVALYIHKYFSFHVQSCLWPLL